jgi:hypothetical protein
MAFNLFLFLKIRRELYSVRVFLPPAYQIKLLKVRLYMLRLHVPSFHLAWPNAIGFNPDGSILTVQWILDFNLRRGHCGRGPSYQRGWLNITTGLSHPPPCPPPLPTSATNLKRAIELFS